MKLDTQLAARFRDELFDAEERTLLSSVQGSTYIDIADRMLHYFGRFNIRSPNANEFIKSAAVLKDSEGVYILEQLRTLNTELENLMNPKKFYKEGDSYSKSNTNLINDFTSNNKTIDSSGNFTYSFNELSNQSKATGLVRGANTQTSQKNKGIENKWKKDVLVDVSTQLVGKKTFDPNKVLQEDKIVDVREAHYELIPEEREAEDVGGELYSVLNVGLTGNAASNYSANNTENLSLTRGDNKVDSTSNTYSNTDYNSFKDYKSYVHNEAVMKSIRLKLPKLKTQFFNIFTPLFDL